MARAVISGQCSLHGALSSLIVNDYGCDLCIVYVFCADKKSQMDA
jgi:hypothetical protein